MMRQSLGFKDEGSRSSVTGRVWRYGPLLLWLAFISFASTREFSAANTSPLLRPILLWFFPNVTEAQLAIVHLLVRKAAHFSEYALLGFLARRAFVTSTRAFIQRNWFGLGVLLVVIYALLDEFHQSFVPSRTASIYDSMIDMGGGVTVLLICRWFGKRASVRADLAAKTPGSPSPGN